MPQVRSRSSDYTGFTVNRTALAAILLALASPSWAAGTALQDARRLAGGKVETYDGGCTGGSCGAQEPICENEACRINRAADGALQTGGLVVREGREPRPAVIAEVPAPALTPDKKGSHRRISTLGGAAAGAGIGWRLGGVIGALIGGLIGAIGGFFLSK